MLTLSQLLVLTQQDRRRFKVSYTIDALNAKAAEDNSGDFIQFSAVVLGGKEPRKSMVRLYGSEIDPSASSKVSCSCPYFRIRLAIPMYLAGSTEIRVGRDEIPEKYRGNQRPGLCPHLLTLCESLLSMNSTEMDRLRQQSPRVSVNDRLRRLT